MSTFLCPSTDPYDNEVGTIVILHPNDQFFSYAYFPKGQGGDNLGRTNYLGVGGWFGSARISAAPTYVGVFTNRSKNNMSAITDGTSNTLLFGELIGGGESPQYQNQFAFSFAWIGAGAMPTGYGITQPNRIPDWFKFSSEHPGVVQFCLGDGSVRGLSLTAGFADYIFTSGRHDGRLFDSAIMP